MDAGGKKSEREEEVESEGGLDRVEREKERETSAV